MSEDKKTNKDDKAKKPLAKFTIVPLILALLLFGAVKFAGLDNAPSGQVRAGVPQNVRDLPVSTSVEVSDVVIGSYGQQGKTTGLDVSGKGKPGGKVLIYLFSDPLVLSAVVDSNGSWRYSVQDPLAPGDHEAYAAFDSGDGKYARSSVFNFAIEKVQASSTDPNGYKLVIKSVQPTATENNRTITYYIVAVIGLILILVGLLSYFIIGKRFSGVYK